MESNYEEEEKDEEVDGKEGEVKGGGGGRVVEKVKMERVEGKEGKVDEMEVKDRRIWVQVCICYLRDMFFLS